MQKLFKVIAAGIMMTIQDRGRYSFRVYGVPVSGACDIIAHDKLNLILGNDENASSIEITGAGTVLEAEADAFIAITGGDLTPVINGKSIPMYERIKITKGDILEFKKINTGLRSYISAEGGIHSLPGISGEKLKSGDIVYKNEVRAGLPVSVKKDVYNTGIITLRVVMGPDIHKFTKKGLKTFLKNTYTVSPLYNRMGIRLMGPVIDFKDSKEILTHGVVKGSIQVPGNGQPIILMNDAQTSGGYSVIGCVITKDLSFLAQAKEGDRIKFKKTNKY